MKKVRFGLIGCGGIGNTHADALLSIDEVDLVAVCDIDLAKAQAVAARHSIPHVFSSAEEMLDQVELDAVSVATDHKHHFVPALAAIERGINVIIEKPITTSLEEAHQLLEAASTHNVKLGGVFQRRFFPSAQRMHSSIEEGRIGKVAVAECIALLGRDREYFERDAWRGTWLGEGGGALMNQAIHMVDMLLWMMGTPNEVYGRWATLKHGAYIDVEDTTVAVVGFDSGALATIVATTVLGTVERAPGFRLAVHGTGAETVGLSESPELTQAVTDQWTFEGEIDQKAEWLEAESGRTGFPEFHSNQLRDFALAVLENREPTVTGADAVRALEVIKGIYLSEAVRRPIPLPMSMEDRLEADRLTNGVTK